MANVNEIVLPDGTSATIEDGTLWSGHKADWEALTTEEQSKYRYVMFDDDSETGEVTDEVADGNMKPVTSNAVYDALQKAKFVHEKFSGTTDASGNVQIRPYDQDYIPVFASVNNKNYSCYVLFWKATVAFYAHVINSQGVTAPENISVDGDVYYLKVENMESIN